MKARQIFILVFATVLITAGVTVSVFQFIGNNTGMKQHVPNDLVARLDQMEARLQSQKESHTALQNRITAALSEFSERTAAMGFMADQEPEIAEIEINRIPVERGQAALLASEMNRSEVDTRLQTLIKAGLSEEEAALIIKSESDLTLQQLQQRYEGQRRAWERAVEQNTARLARVNPLRTKLGEDLYERYLEANGLSTSARVGTVIESSPGYNAGLQSGDRILRYDNQRVFNLSDLSNLTYQGEKGENVLLEIERDGQPLQLTIPRGPIGVSSGRNRVRR